MLVAVNRYIDLLTDSEGVTRTLGVVDVFVNDASGRPECFVGNRSVVFKIRCGGRAKMLKCYTVPKPNLRRIYGSRCLRDELYVPSSDGGGEYVDVVLDDWVEGCTLREAVSRAWGDLPAMKRLSESFDRFALKLLEADWAHGDLKPENIIVDAEGVMHAIDFDAVYRPDLAGLQCDESGTAAFQHPSRGCGLYDKSIDDYPVALISAALHLLSVDAGVSRSSLDEGFLLFDPTAIAAGDRRMLNYALAAFERLCMGVEYRIAMLLTSPVPQLPGLAELLGHLVRRCEGAAGSSGRLELASRDGLWGYVQGGGFVIAPVFDSGFEFSEGLAAVRLGGTFHFISPAGEPVLSFGGLRAVKPFRNGTALLIGKNGCVTVDRAGRPADPPPCGSGAK